MHAYTYTPVYTRCTPGVHIRTLALVHTSDSTVRHMPAQARMSPPVKGRKWNFSQFSGDLFLVVTLNQVHLHGPLYYLLLLDPSFAPTI